MYIYRYICLFVQGHCLQPKSAFCLSTGVSFINYISIEHIIKVFGLWQTKKIPLALTFKFLCEFIIGLTI